MSAEIILDWADDSRTFRLALAQLQTLEEKCNAGIGVIFQRLLTGGYCVMDIREILRLGLIGAGMTASNAQTLCRRYLDDGGNWQSGLIIAQAVLSAAIIGTEQISDEEEDGQTASPKRQTQDSGKTACHSPEYGAAV